MLVPIEVVTKYVERKCIDLAKNKTEHERICQLLYDKHNLPYDITSDVLTMRKTCGEVSDFVLYCIISALNPKLIEQYFTELEIQQFENVRYVEQKISFPLTFDNMAQISKEQWVGGISVSKLMELREAQLIKYNPNTQKVQLKLRRGNDVLLKPHLEKATVREIKEMHKSRLYVPDPITLNINPESGEYNFQNGVLTIDSDAPFDIIDGYHRYVALSELYNSDNSFDYPVMLQFTWFSEAKAQNFVHQKDQKTKMLRIDSMSLNQQDSSNIIMQRLNEDTDFDLCGKISRNDGIVPLSYAAVSVKKLFNVDERMKASEYPRRTLTELQREIKTKLNNILSVIPELYDEPWDPETCLAVFVTIRYCDSVSDYEEFYRNVANKTKNIKASRISSFYNTKSLRCLDEIMERCAIAVD